MNEDAENAEIGRAFTALRSAKRTHGCLIAKARRLSKALEQTAGVLNRATVPNDVTTGGVEHAVSASALPRELPSVDEARELVVDIHAASAEVRSLELDLERMQ